MERYGIGSVVLGHWKLLRLIGEGSFGKVYEAQREDFGRIYKAAIKIISIPQNQSEVKSVRADGMDEESVSAYFRGFVEDLVDEFDIMARMKGNSNIVSYEDHKVEEHEGEVGWDILIRMELLTPLIDYIGKHTMTKQDAIRLGIDICKALEICQRHNVIHRDLKPENIFVSEAGDFKLGDFGIARTIEKTSSGMSKKGTYAYMAPEVYKEVAYGTSVDIYSLGIVMYWLLNESRTPFLPPYPERITSNDRDTAIRRRMMGDQMAPPKNAEGRLAEIVMKACAHEPKDRYSSPMQMRQELEAILYNRQEVSAIYSSGDDLPSGSIGDQKRRQEVEIEKTESAFRQVKEGGNEKGQEEFLDKTESVYLSRATIPKPKSRLWIPITVGAIVLAVVLMVMLKLCETSGEITTPASEMPTSTSIPMPSAVPAIVWQDSTVEAGVREVIGKATGNVYPEDLSQIEELRLGSQKGKVITTLYDLKHMPNLKTLDLSGITVASTAGLAEKTKLEALNLTGCGCPDGLVPNTLTEIRNMAIGGNKFTEISFVQNMPHLSYLDISDNPITDLSPLADKQELATINANNVLVKDWSPVAHVPSVTGLPEPEPTPTPPPTLKPTATPKPKATPKPTQRPKNTPAPVATPTPVPVQTQPPTPATIDVTGISISRGSLILEVGGMSTLTATVSPSNATNKSVSWASSNSGVVRVSGGTVTAMGPGTATVTASCGGYSASCTVTVN